MPAAYVGVGSNIDPERNVLEALRLLKPEGLEAVSTVYRTEPVGGRGQPRFLNCAARIRTERPPNELVAVLKRVEGLLGRCRSEDMYAPRTIDLDLIAYEEVELNEDGLVLPDPEIETRPFIAIPLVELAAGNIVMPSGKTIKDIAKGISRGYMEPLLTYTGRLRLELFGG